jgi:hypothetical protein
MGSIAGALHQHFADGGAAMNVPAIERLIFLVYLVDQALIGAREAATAAELAEHVRVGKEALADARTLLLALYAKCAARKAGQ